MQFFASVSYIKPFFLILVSLCVVMFQWLSDVVLFHNLLLPFSGYSLFLFFSLSFYLSLSCSSLFFFGFCFCFDHIVKLTPSPMTTHYAVLTKHSEYTSRCLHVYYCVAQAAAQQSTKKDGQPKMAVKEIQILQSVNGKKNHTQAGYRKAESLGIIWHFGKILLYFVLNFELLPYWLPCCHVCLWYTAFKDKIIFSAIKTKPLNNIIL